MTHFNNACATSSSSRTVAQSSSLKIQNTLTQQLNRTNRLTHLILQYLAACQWFFKLILSIYESVKPSPFSVSKEFNLQLPFRVSNLQNVRVGRCSPRIFLNFSDSIYFGTPYNSFSKRVLSLIFALGPQKVRAGSAECEHRERERGLTYGPYNSILVSNIMFLRFCPPHAVRKCTSGVPSGSNTDWNQNTQNPLAKRFTQV